MHGTGFYSASVCGNDISSGNNGYIVIVSYLSSDPQVTISKQLDIWDPQTASFEGDYLIVQTGDNVIKAFFIDFLVLDDIKLVDEVSAYNFDQNVLEIGSVSTVKLNKTNTARVIFTDGKNGLKAVDF